MINIIAHELAEAVTDPTLASWYFSNGNELADQCAWSFSTTYSCGSACKYNVQLGGKQYLLQTLWENAHGGACVDSYR